MGNLNDDQAREIIDASIRPMRSALCLNDWRVEVEYRTLPESTMGMCSTLVAYRRATIAIDSAQHKSREDLLDTLRHELLHLLHGYFDLPRRLVNEHLQGDAFDAIEFGFETAAEHTVLACEQFLDSIGYTPQALIDRGKADLDRWDGHRRPVEVGNGHS